MSKQDIVYEAKEPETSLLDLLLEDCQSVTDKKKAKQKNKKLKAHSNLLPERFLVIANRSPLKIIPDDFGTTLEELEKHMPSVAREINAGNWKF